MKPSIPKAILAIDDNEEFRELVSRSLKKAGVKNSIRFCVNGADALDYLNQCGKYDQESAPLPGLVLLDLNMPGIDGYEVLKKVKLNPKLKIIPIIVLSTSDAQSDVDLCYELGTNGYISKPKDYLDFIEAMRRIKECFFETLILPIMA